MTFAVVIMRAFYPITVPRVFSIITSSYDVSSPASDLSQVLWMMSMTLQICHLGSSNINSFSLLVTNRLAFAISMLARFKPSKDPPMITDVVSVEKARSLAVAARRVG